MFKLGSALRGGKQLGWTTAVALQYPSYVDFERQVWSRFKPALRNHQFDVVHRLSPMSPTLPSFLASKSPVPFVIGPLNGGLSWPPGFQGELRREREYMTHVRQLHRYLPFYRSTYSRATAILAAFSHTRDDLPSYVDRDKVILLPEVGIDPTLFNGEPRTPATEPMKFVFVGRLVPYKCCDVVVRAFAQSPLLRKSQLLIVGDGPDRPLIESLIREHKLESCVQMLGWCSQARVGEILRESQVFAFPSIRELGAGVVVEAMACGAASVVVDYGGPGGLVAADRGVKIALGTKDELVGRFAEEMERLQADPTRVADLGNRGREFVLRQYAWSAKAEKIVDVYRWVLGRRDRPSFLC
jgi:glycosyltransferase involved in cell wall biosynthesis